jgi:AcrR family transcriptional regulator
MANTHIDVPARSERAPSTDFRRATREDAVDVTLQTLVGEARVDMQTLAARLGVSPATLYRWFGTRAQLLDATFERLSREFCGQARASAVGSGDELVCDYARRLMTLGTRFQPLRTFVSREPQLALRLLLGEDGAVRRVVVESMRELLGETRGADQVRVLGEQIDVIVQVATALVWATYAIGEEPQIDRAVSLVRLILASSPAA